ncbi:prepilin-type N-terminal cleavage/methylation domain-containing protein [Candidatus Falkowbacteria bacterium]|nr:prepilin-type N-terminal cleavage/methylation domain-containing protein [Candidatus Falkowbacteria bacterium]
MSKSNKSSGFTPWNKGFALNFVKTKFYSTGFTLLEVMIAITILIIGILAVARIFPLALKVAKSAEQATIAINLAQAKIEEIFYLDYDNIPIGAIEAKHRLADDMQNPFYYYQRQTVAEYVDSDLNYSATETGLKKITVTAYWRSSVLALEKSRDLIILISKK